MEEYNDGQLPSKTELKREMDELQSVGIRLMELKPAELDRLPLTDRLRYAIDQSQRIKSHEARRRHAQFVGRLMREDNGEAVIEALDELRNPWRQRWLLDWQDRLISVQDARDAEPLVTELLERYPEGDRQHIRNLCRNALGARVGEEADNSATEKFRRERRKLADYLNDLEKHQPL